MRGVARHVRRSRSRRQDDFFRCIIILAACTRSHVEPVHAQHCEYEGVTDYTLECVGVNAVRQRNAAYPTASPDRCATHAPISAEPYGIACAARIAIHKRPSM